MFDLVLFCEWMIRTTYEYSSVFRIRIQKNEFFLKTIPFGFPRGASFVDFSQDGNWLDSRNDHDEDGGKQTLVIRGLRFSISLFRDVRF